LGLQNLTVAQACKHKERPSLRAAERRFILTSYGVPNWTGQNSELDHRVPFSFGGTTDRAKSGPRRAASRTQRTNSSGTPTTGVP
jgi:hypothetical protein